MSSSHREVVAYNSSIINTKLNESLDIRWHDSNLENKLRQDLMMDVMHYQKYNVIHYSIDKFLNLIDNDSPFSDISHCVDMMESSSLACKKMIKNAVHLCHDVSPLEDKIFACRLFVKQFDLALGEEVNMSVDNLSINDQNNEHYFFYISQCNDSPGKDVKSLQMEVVLTLTSYMDSQLLKVDIYRLAKIRSWANHIRMCLSRIDQPLKKFNNDKGFGQRKTTQMP